MVTAKNAAVAWVHRVVTMGMRWNDYSPESLLS